jgi:hypothetical protein
MFQNEQLKPQFTKQIKLKQIKLIGDEENQIQRVLEVQGKKQAQQKQHFDKWTEEAKDFLVSKLKLNFFLKFSRTSVISTL